MDWINNDNLLQVCEKGRRVGITFAESYRSMFLAFTGVTSSYYTTYNLPACKSFIEKVARWAKAFNLACQYTTGTSIIDGNSINTFSVRFVNGYHVTALPGNPENLRGVEGRILIDEAAFRHDLEETLKAALPANTWGYQVCVWSTHNGIDHPFNKLCQDVREGRKPGSLKRLPFREAVAKGLYRKICEVKGWTYQPIKELDWVRKEYEKQGEGASEELDAIPRKYSNNNIFKEEYFCQKEYSDYEIDNALKIRYWDLATGVKETSYYTATILCAVINGILIILEYDAQKLPPTEGDDWIIKTSAIDDPSTVILIEQENKSSGLKYTEYMSRTISNRFVEGYHPDKNKMVRALPLVTGLKRRQIVLNSKMPGIPRLTGLFCQFDGSPQPMVNDLVDCLSGIWDYCQQSYPDWIAE
ncbi:hypothetical protein HC928_02870 [bacterium]|nr:hypothetical protein [bacterium]